MPRVNLSLFIPVVRTVMGRVLRCSCGVFLGLVPTSQPAEIIDRVLAIVEGEVITLSDSRGAIDLGLITPNGEADALVDVLEQLINRQLILIEVERYPPPSPNPTAVSLRFKQIRESFTTPEAFSHALEVSGMNEQRLRDLLRDDIRIQAYLEQRFGSAAQLTEDEVARYYREHREDFTQEGEVRSYAEVQEASRDRLLSERRLILINEWTVGLRSRANVEIYYQP